MGPAQVEQLLDLVSGLPEPPKLIVVDTLARCVVDDAERAENRRRACQSPN